MSTWAKISSMSTWCFSLLPQGGRVPNCVQMRGCPGGRKWKIRGQIAGNSMRQKNREVDWTNLNNIINEYYIIFYYIVLYYIALYYIILYHINILYYMILYYIILYHNIIEYYMILYYIILYHIIILYYIHDIILYYAISYYYIILHDIMYIYIYVYCWRWQRCEIGWACPCWPPVPKSKDTGAAAFCDSYCIQSHVHSGQSLFQTPQLAPLGHTQQCTS